MKLLLDALQALNQSGTGTYVQQLLQRLPQSGFVSVGTALGRPGLTAPKWHLAELPVAPRISSIYQRHLRFGRMIDRFEPDVVHFPANFGTLLPARSKLRPAIVATVHDVTFFRCPSWFPRHRAVFYQIMARQTAKQADIVITDSESSAADIETFLRVPPERLAVVPLGTDGESEPTPAAVSEVKSRYHLPDEYCLYLGTIEPRKNIPALIRSWDSIAADSACDLVIAGREGWKTRTFRDALQRATHRDRIHVLGFVPEADRVPLMAGAAVFVWPSLYEGFGLPPLDAMALGTPVLTSDTSSMPEVCENAALLVDPHDENSIATGLQQILSDDKLRDQLEHAGRDRAHRLSWSRTVEYTIDAYQRALRMRR